jgi:hypothetical protein
MASLFGYKIHVANFYDNSGSYIGSHVFHKSFKLGIPKKSFSYNSGTYHIKPLESTRFKTSFFPYFFDYYFYDYRYDNPDPIKKNLSFKPVINASDYHTLLESKRLVELNKVRQSGLSDLLTPRNIIIGLVLIAVVYYFYSGGSLT